MSAITRRNFVKNGAVGLAGCGLGSGLLGYATNSALASSMAGNSLRIIHITDTHMDLAKPQSVKLVEMFVDKVNRDFSSVDFVLFGGDNFNNNVVGDGDAAKFKTIADGLHCPWLAVRGNKEASPKPKGDSLNQAGFAEMFFPKTLAVTGRDWKVTKGDYTILGLDTTIDGHNNGLYTPETLAFVEDELRANPKQHYILLNHHAYLNYWQSTDSKDIHKYVLNNDAEVAQLVKGSHNLKLTLSGHKHRNDMSTIGTTNVISTVGFKVAVGEKKDHQFRLVEMTDGIVSEKIVGIL